MVLRWQPPSRSIPPVKIVKVDRMFINCILQPDSRIRGNERRPIAGMQIPAWPLRYLGVFPQVPVPSLPGIGETSADAGEHVANHSTKSSICEKATSA